MTLSCVSYLSFAFVVLTQTHTASLRLTTHSRYDSHTRGRPAKAETLAKQVFGGSSSFSEWRTSLLQDTAQLDQLLNLTADYVSEEQLEKIKSLLGVSVENKFGAFQKSDAKRQSKNVTVPPCGTGEDTLPEEMFLLSFFIYEDNNDLIFDHTKNVQEKLTNYSAYMGQCWKVSVATGEHDDNFAELDMPSRIVVFNPTRCIKATVFEGTRTTNQFERQKLKPESVLRDGNWLKGLADSFFDPNKKQWIEKVCGNPMVTELYAWAYEEHLTFAAMRQLEFKTALLLKNLTLGTLPASYAEYSYSKFSDQCPNGFKKVTTGHSLGAPLATMNAYCSAYHWYDLWQKTHKKTPWPEWLINDLFYQAAYTFAAPPTGNGELINLGAFVSETDASPDMCWKGGRYFFGGALIHDPIPDTYCCQNNDPIPSINLMDAPIPNLFHKVPCSCPSTLKPGAPREMIVKQAGMCMGYAKYSLGCPKCDQVFYDPGLKAHKTFGPFHCGVVASTQVKDADFVKTCGSKYLDLFVAIATQAANATAPCPKGRGPTISGPLCPYSKWPPL